jgi:hypothetical protein
MAQLSEKERAELAVWLLDSLPPHKDEDAIEESIQEADRRKQELESGRVLVISDSEIWSSLGQERRRCD